MLIFEKTTHSAEETAQVGKELAELIMEERQNGAYFPDGVTFVAMYGTLGAGKTAFVSGMASVIAPQAAVCSPTYTVVNEYRGDKIRLCHFDMYRIGDDDDLYSIGFYDYTDCVIAAEWCENIPYALPDVRYEVHIEKSADNDGIRLVKVERTGE